MYNAVYRNVKNPSMKKNKPILPTAIPNSQMYLRFTSAAMDDNSIEICKNITAIPNAFE